RGQQARREDRIQDPAPPPRPGARRGRVLLVHVFLRSGRTPRPDASEDRTRGFPGSFRDMKFCEDEWPRCRDQEQPTTGWRTYGSSRAATSSGVSFRESAATASSRCFGLVMPTMGAVTTGLCRSQARATVARETPWRAATCPTRSTTRRSDSTFAVYSVLP